MSTNQLSKLLMYICIYVYIYIYIYIHIHTHTYVCWLSRNTHRVTKCVVRTHAHTHTHTHTQYASCKKVNLEKCAQHLGDLNFQRAR